ncbi:MAG: hypothetical protein ABFD79_12505 [Phycisphaerales bacterium]
MSLEINDDTAFQKKIWFIERIFWIAMFIFVILSFFGFFGQGPASKTCIEKNNIIVNYSKFLRFGDFTTIKIRLPQQSHPVIGLPEDYVNNLQSITIVPEPEKTFFTRERIKYIFMIDETSPAEINITFKPAKRGRLNGSIENNGTCINFSQFIYP